ncbi:DUF2235 domain-containing protein [Pseudomonas moorei]|uniref:DUF2235 domain-containing protein n=1 Tax=Pseudomonas moorei TaxID=395599 RepID=UPI001FF6DF9F|nr:DUF2235 domain-containing protein [Pseudomonas moorei]
MTKQILLFSDGTGNSSAKAQKTNVWRLFQAVDLTLPDQIAFYDDGVGSSSNKYLAILGGVFGWGLKRNVIDIYKFVCRNYKNGDQISGFGFSRGAFTIRVLVGLMTHEGLLKPMSEEELDRYARAAYRSYRSTRFIKSHNPVVHWLRVARDQYLHLYDRLRGFPTYTKTKNLKPSLHFLGLWDTVGAYQIPLDTLKQAINLAIWPMLFVDLTLGVNVKRACHALSLDDERRTFHPVLWDEEGEAELIVKGEVAPGRLTQVWFAGVHSNVGGGYPEDQLSYVPLHWIMSEAAASGIRLLPGAASEVAAEKSPFARIYDSRSGFAAFYRYEPRQIRPLHYPSGVTIEPIIDSSVLLRMARGTDHYASITLPGRFRVLGPLGTVTPMISFPPTARPALSPVSLLAPPAQLANFTPVGVVIPDPIALQVVGDTIWWRRLLYVVQVVFAVLLASLPVLPDTSDSGQTSSAALQISHDAVRFAINAIKGLLPSISTRWTDAFGAHPDLFVLLVAGLLSTFYLGVRLKTRIADRVRLAWHANFRARHLVWCVQSARGGRNTTCLALVIAFGLFLISLVIQGTVPTTKELGGASLALWLLLAWREYRLRILEKFQRAPEHSMPTTFALDLAHRLRSNPSLVNGYNYTMKYVLPTFAIALFLFLAVMVINRAVFDASLAAGKICISPEPNAPTNFKTNEICWPSGIQLVKGATYEITLTTDGNWFDLAERGDVGGFATDTSAHLFAMLLRRYWFEPWFKPVARIGVTGDDEYVLDPVNPFTAHHYKNEHCEPRSRFLPLSGKEATARMNADRTPADRKTLAAKITAQTSGELFIYVNDAILAPPFNTKLFYSNNYGDAVVTVERLYPDGILPSAKNMVMATSEKDEAPRLCKPANNPQIDDPK